MNAAPVSVPVFSDPNPSPGSAPRNRTGANVKVSIPPVLRRLCGDESIVRVHPGTVGDVIEQLHRRYNGIRDRLCDPQGRLRGSVLIFVNDEDIRFLANRNTVVQDGDEVCIIPAFAGG